MPKLKYESAGGRVMADPALMVQQPTPAFLIRNGDAMGALLDLDYVDAGLASMDLPTAVDALRFWIGEATKPAGEIRVLVDLLRDAEAVLETIADDCSEDDGESLRILIGRIRHALEAHDLRTLQRARRAT